MSVTLTVTLEGLDEAIKKLGKVAGAKMMGRAMLKFGKEIKVKATPYPPEGPWNRPRPYPARWYQRLFGPRWMHADGSYGGRDTSEQMQQCWYVQQSGAMQVTIENRASYSNWVMGAEQTGFHAAHGWQRIDDLAQKMHSEWHAIFDEELEAALR